jgi:hypothetical protein
MQNQDRFLIGKVAREFVSCLGFDAPAYLEEQAELAAEQGDELSARAWRDIADAAERVAEDRVAA